MKKLISLLFIGATIFACGDDKVDASKTEAAPVGPAVENVEGNLPDSTNSVNLNQSLPIDSSHLRDSMPR